MTAARRVKMTDNTYGTTTSGRAECAPCYEGLRQWWQRQSRYRRYIRDNMVRETSCKAECVPWYERGTEAAAAKRVEMTHDRQRGTGEII